ncbi:hypothetical protein Leryth_006249 [Lithospermum erythrorhizon]|nr:hypothetical protein Leryth_006249 [Lithospermum erythrorhizon]
MDYVIYGFVLSRTVEAKTMMQQKRTSVSLEQSSIVSFTTSKRHKGDILITSKMKKEKFSERIQALQQLVSPYGKTDTASVLHEAMGYISFLHEQVKVLSSPYLQSTLNTEAPGWESCTLRNKGLCLVPVSLTIGFVGDNGADIWAPIKTITPHSRSLAPDETSIESHC